MKSHVRRVLFIAMVSFAHILQAQLTNDLSAIEATTPLSADQVPPVATFYSAATPFAPPMPGNMGGYPAWDLGGGIYLLDDLDPSLATFGGGFHAMDDSGPFPGGGGDGGDGGGFTNSIPPYAFPTNGLWLWITNIANQTVYANLNGGTDFVYEVFSKADLMTPNWDIETEVFPGESTNVMPFTVPQLGRTNLFLWARDWTGITSRGNITPDWWFYYYFGTTNLSDTNRDSDDTRLVYDYTNGFEPTAIDFSLQFTNDYYDATPVAGTINLTNGQPFYEAVLVDDTNFDDAAWQYLASTNLSIPLTSGDGIYTVFVGLRGPAANSKAIWQEAQVTLNTMKSMFVITNPINRTVSQPMIQLQGLVSGMVSKLTFNISNTAGITTNQQGYWTPVAFDPNTDNFTTNSFECYDIHLAGGTNIITLHATDPMGHVSTTNVNFTLDYSSRTNNPLALSILWPQDGMSIGGDSFTFQTQVSDDTASVMVQVANTNGESDQIHGLVERSGLVLVNNLPLAPGANILTITVTNAAGDLVTTNITVTQSGVTVTMDPLTELNQTNVMVTGTISVPGDTITINGTPANPVDDLGDWEADGVPVSATGAAMFDVEVYSNEVDLVDSQHFIQPQPPLVVMADYAYDSVSHGQSATSQDHYKWGYATGGEWSEMGAGTTTTEANKPGPPYFSFLSGTITPEGSDYSSAYTYHNGPFYNFPVVWENAQVNADGGSITVKSDAMIVQNGSAIPGVTNLYLVTAEVLTRTDPNPLISLATPLPPETALINGQAGAGLGITNDDGTIPGSFAVTALSGVTNFPLIATASNINDIVLIPVSITSVTLQIIDANTGTNLSAQENAVIVGQQMNLTCQLSMTNAVLNNSMLTNFQWTIPGDAISNYVVAADASSAFVATNFPTTNSNIQFYWVDGANGRAVQCSATIDGATITGQAVFNVIRPAPQFFAPVVGAIAVDTNYHNFDYSISDGSIVDNGLKGGTWLHFGVVSSWSNVGIAFAFSNAPIVSSSSTAYGRYFLVQIVNTSDIKENVVNTTNLSGVERTSHGLDSEYPFQKKGDLWHPEGMSLSDRTNDMWFDAPAEGLDATMAWLTRTDSFTLYLMFIDGYPDYSDSTYAKNIPIPMYSVTWSWSGTVVTNGTFGSFILSSPSLPSPVISTTTTYPTWNLNVTNFIYQTNNIPFDEN